jgi:hypothetical protein
MIASLKGYGRIARTVLAILAVLLAMGIAGSLWMGVRARQQAETSVINQARDIANNSLALAFTPDDLTGAVSAQRALELSNQVRAIVLDPSEFTDVTLLSPDGKILYSTKLSLVGTDLPGEKNRIALAIDGTPQTLDVDSVYSVMLPMELRSGVGETTAVVLERPDATIANAPGPWKTNALFLFALLVLLGVAVFGVARVLSVVANTDDRAVVAPTRPQQVAHATVAPSRAEAHPGMRAEGEARRRAEERAHAAEQRLTLLQEQYQKALDDLQTFQRTAREPAKKGANPRLEERALRAEGQVATLQQQIQTLAAEREQLAIQLQEVEGLDADPLAEARLRHAEREADELRGELATANRQMTAMQRQLDAAGAQAADEPGVAAELDATRSELMRAKDARHSAEGQLGDAERELTDARTELRALRNEEQRAAMLTDELRSVKAELESLNASHRADLAEREVDLEEKVRTTREDFQRQLEALEQTYRGQIGQRESDLAARTAQAEADARAAVRELEATKLAMEAARAEAESREQRLIQAAGELTQHKQHIAELGLESKERTVAIGQARKEAEDLRRSVVGLQADLVRADQAVTHMRADLDATRARSEQLEASAASHAKEREALTERVDKMARMLEAAAAENAEVNRRLQDFEARRQFELADDEGRSEIDDLLRVTQERLAGQTEKLIAAEDRVREMEGALKDAKNRAEIAEGDLRTHQMSEALREIRGESVEAAAARELTIVHEAPAGEPQPDMTFTKELSEDAKKHLSRINGLAQLLKHQKGAKEQAQLLKQLGVYAKRLDATVSDLSEADGIARGTVELQPRRTDLEALVSRVVEESEIGVDLEVRVVAEPIMMTIDPRRAEQTLVGMLRVAAERTPNNKAITVRLQHVDDGALVSVEDPEPAAGATMSPVIQRFAELQGGWTKVEEREGGGTAFRLFVPDAAGGVPRPRPPVEEVPPSHDTIEEELPMLMAQEQTAVEPSPEQILSRELRRLAEAESSSGSSSRRRRR